MSVADYNTDPNANTSISGINIAEGCPPSGINNAIRQMMADIKAADDADVKMTGNQTIAGVKTFSSDVVAGTIRRDVDNSEMRFVGGTSFSSNASLVVYGKTASGNPGYFRVRANDGSLQTDLIGKPDGTLTWNSKEFVYTSGDQTIAGTKTFSNAIAADITGNAATATNASSLGGVAASGYVATSGDQAVAGLKSFSSSVVATSTTGIRRDVDNSEMRLDGGSSFSNGASLVVYGKTASGNAGNFRVRANNGTSQTDLVGKPDGTLTWNGQPVQTSSDERIKTPLAGVPDAVLDAWGDVGWGQYKYLDAVEAKGESARLHLGLIAQHVKAVFEERGLDACAYGILCHEERPASEDEQAVDLWMVRYTEAAAMEAAYQRRRADRAEARLADIEVRLSVLEAKA